MISPPALRGQGQLLVAIAASVLCSGCDRIPGTQGFAEEKAKRAVGEQLLDPTAAEFRNIQTRSGTVCGEVNGKNKLGAYVGFSRFVVDLATYKPLIDPQFDLTDLFSARDFCRELSTSEYSSASTTLSACNRVSELELQSARQQTFDAAWAQHCEGNLTRQVYRPPLADTQSQATNASSAPEIAPPPASSTVPPEASANDEDEPPSTDAVGANSVDANPVDTSDDDGNDVGNTEL